MSQTTSFEQIIGIKYKEGLLYHSIYFSEPFKVFSKSIYAWNTKTGIITYQGASAVDPEIIGTSGKTILEIPVGKPLGEFYFIYEDNQIYPAIIKSLTFYEYYR